MTTPGIDHRETGRTAPVSGTAKPTAARWRDLLATHLPPVAYRTPEHAAEPESATSQTRYPQLNDPEWLEERYVTYALTITQIAGELGCTPPAVRKALGRHGLLGKQAPAEQRSTPGVSATRHRSAWAVTRPGKRAVSTETKPRRHR